MKDLLFGKVGSNLFVLSPHWLAFYLFLFGRVLLFFSRPRVDLDFFRR